MKRVKITIERLKQIVNYDPVAGVFTWVSRHSNRAAGSVVGTIDPNGYRYLKLEGEWYLGQRLAWLYVHGEWPDRKLAFDDGNTANIAIANLSLPKWGDMKRDKSAKNAYEKAHRQSNPMWHRGRNLKRDFGISLDQYQDAFAAQGGVCACCHKPEVSERDGKRKWLAVDHDHVDGSFRGLLCSSCNQGIGRFKDDIEVLRRAADYIEAHAAKPKTNVIPLAGRRIDGRKGGNS